MKIGKMADSWDWADEIISQRRDPVPELPEDSLIFLLRKNPLLEEMIEKLDLAMEI